MPVADLADALEIAGHRRNHARRGAAHGLGDESGDVARPQAQNLGFQFVGGAAPVFGLRLVVAAMAVGIAGRDVRGVDEHFLVGLAPPHVAAHRKRADGIAVIALAARDEARARRVAALQVILARHLQRRLDRLGAARQHIHH